MDRKLQRLGTAAWLTQHRAFLRSHLLTAPLAGSPGCAPSVSQNLQGWDPAAPPGLCSTLGMPMDGGAQALQVIMGKTETCTGLSHPQPAHGCFRSILRSPNQAASAGPATGVALSLNLQHFLSQHSHSGCKAKGNSWDLGAFMC